MNLRPRSIYVIVTLIGIVVALAIYGQAIKIGNSYRNTTNQTATAIVSQNQAIETFIHLTSTATARFQTGTFKATPSS